MISIFDLFSIGVGPSSSHTVGPMRAAFAFAEKLEEQGLIDQVTRFNIELFGSLAHTGKGHGTDMAVILGSEGQLPKSIDPDNIQPRLKEIHQNKQINLFDSHTINFDPDKDLIFNFDDLLPRHTNGMQFTAYKNDEILLQENYYSIGGGFIMHEDDDLEKEHTGAKDVPYPFDTAEQLLKHCKKDNKTIAEIMMTNECSVRSAEDVREGIFDIVKVMRNSIIRGCETDGILPGGLDVKRRAPGLARKLSQRGKPTSYKETDSIDWLNAYAIAVNEENAAGSKIVTAPTNGAAGVIPAVLNYYIEFYPGVDDDCIIDFMLTAAAIAVLYKKGASISAAEVGCQGEVGVASSMAAGALAAVLGGSIMQVASAAEIAMEHSLGLTCDPVGGLVQIPCIERNAVGAVKAVNVARLALLETGESTKVSLDKVIDSMKRTGLEMSTKYKETSQGGLAKIKVNVVEC